MQYEPLVSQRKEIMLRKRSVSSNRRRSNWNVTLPFSLFSIFWILMVVIAFRDGALLTSSKKKQGQQQRLEPQNLHHLLPSLTTYSRSTDARQMTADVIDCDRLTSTDQMHASPTGRLIGTYAFFRQQLDYTYHNVYTASRQHFQDTIVDSLLSQAGFVDVNGRYCRRPKDPWIVFTAGAMGAGKSRTIKDLDARGYFPLDAFVVVDPDQIRRQLPEFDNLVQACPEKAGECTRRESGMIAELAIEACLDRGYNVLVDGSLSNAAWYKEYFATLRRSYPNYRIAVLHVTASRQVVLERALNRARFTGRVVPPELLKRTMDLVPDSVRQLGSLVDFCIEINNNGDDREQEIGTNGVTWSTFQEQWRQECVE